MTRLHFDFSRINRFDSSATRIFRRCVLDPVWDDYADPSKVKRLYPQYVVALKVWRDQIAALRTAKWDGVYREDKETSLRTSQYFGNCPPYGLRPPDDEHKARVCRRNRICPWCYGREVIAELVYSLSLIRRITPKEFRKKFRLVAWTQVRDAIIDPTVGLGSLDLPKWPRAIGSFRSAVVWPSDMPGMASIRLSGLFYVPEGAKLPPGLREGLTGDLRADAWKATTLGDLLYPVLAYPASLLDPSNAANVARVLHWCSKEPRRLLATAGVLHNTHLREYFAHCKELRWQNEESTQPSDTSSAEDLPTMKTPQE